MPPARDRAEPTAGQLEVAREIAVLLKHRTEGAVMPPDWTVGLVHEIASLLGNHLKNSNSSTCGSYPEVTGMTKEQLERIRSLCERNESHNVHCTTVKNSELRQLIDAAVRHPEVRAALEAMMDDFGANLPAGERVSVDMARIVLAEGFTQGNSTCS